jgi:imidazolonepropionase-like amidohydrolase
VVLDLAIRGATVVTPGHREAADIGIAGGRIAQLGGTMTGAQELAAGGLLAIPGGVDAHTPPVSTSRSPSPGRPSVPGAGPAMPPASAAGWNADHMPGLREPGIAGARRWCRQRVPGGP